MRCRNLNRAAIRTTGDYVLYWMVAYRRAHYNAALDRALEHARSLNKPLLVFEGLRVGYRWASDRLHRFVLQGMADNLATFTAGKIAYYPYVEPEAGAGRGLLEALARRACLVVTDDFPCFFLPRMARAAADKLEALGAPLEAVDGNGLYPTRDTDRIFTTAHSFRRHLQKRLPRFLGEAPKAQPLSRHGTRPHRVPESVLARWPSAEPRLREGNDGLGSLPIDHTVTASTIVGGEVAARHRLERFLKVQLSQYPDDRNHPDEDGGSGLSPYLHFGHISAHEVFQRVTDREEWQPNQLAAKPNGSRHGWWGLSEAAEGFLDELVTWRELGFNMCTLNPRFDQYESLPAWAQQTLAQHTEDPRAHTYSLAEFEEGRTHDALWNAAQRQLVLEGRMHNYLRMLWGKKILEWTRTPREALSIMIELNNKYALDGRDPNSYSGIFWVLGRYDRAWGPERPIFGKIRFMSSDNTRRKLRLREYLDRYGPGS